MIVKLPWKVVCSQAVNRYSVADLGQYSHGLYPQCHELFCSKSTSATESSRTFSPCRGVVFSSRYCCSPRVTERYPGITAFLKTPADDFVSPSANCCTRVGTHISPDHLCVSPHFCRTPFSQRCHRQCRAPIFGHARVLGQTIEQALTTSNNSDGQVLVTPLVSRNSFPNQYFT